MLLGFALSFGLVLLIRALRSSGVDTAGLADSVAWSLVTGLPALGATAVFVYYEIFKVDRNPIRTNTEEDAVARIEIDELDEAV
jgi:hypothetical protein